MDYKMIVEVDSHVMADNVNVSCQSGWEPYGSPMVACVADEKWYHYQAMIKRTPETVTDVQQQANEMKPNREFNDCTGKKSGLGTCGFKNNDKTCRLDMCNPND